MSGWMWLSVGLLCCLAEMMTGSFYLLAIGLGLMEASLIEFMGFGLTWQIGGAAFGVVVNVFVAHRLRQYMQSRTGVSMGDLDVGHRVRVLRWNEDGSAVVFYREAEWMADKVSKDVPDVNWVFIRRVAGNRLVVSDIKEDV